MKPVSIDAAKQLAVRAGAEGVAVFAFGGEDFAATSYGVSKELCARMKEWIKEVSGRLERGELPNPLDDGQCPWPAITQD
jgi:hypothetical protein